MKQLIALAVTALAVAACAADNTAAPASAPTAPCGGSGALSTTKASAGAPDLFTKGNPLAAGDLPFATGSTGELLVETGRRDGPGANGETALRPGILTVLDPATGRRQVVRGRRSLQPGTQTMFGALDRDHVVWTQKTGTDLGESAWSMYAADRRTGAIALIAQAHPVDDKGLTPTVPGYTIPHLHGGKVYWVGARPAATAGKPPTIGIYARPLDRSAPEALVVPNAIRPVISGPWLYYVALDAADAARPGYAIHRRSLLTGRAELVRRATTGPGVEFITADGDTAAWLLTDRTVQVQRGTAGPVVTIRAADGELPGWPSAAAGLIGFSDGSGGTRGAYVFDVRHSCLHNLAPGAGTQILLGGRTVAWRLQTPTGELRWQVARHRPGDR